MKGFYSFLKVQVCAVAIKLCLTVMKRGSVLCEHCFINEVKSNSVERGGAGWACAIHTCRYINLLFLAPWRRERRQLFSCSCTLFRAQTWSAYASWIPPTGYVASISQMITSLYPHFFCGYHSLPLTLKILNQLLFEITILRLYGEILWMSHGHIYW